MLVRQSRRGLAEAALMRDGGKGKDHEQNRKAGVMSFAMCSLSLLLFSSHFVRQHSSAAPICGLWLASAVNYILEQQQGISWLYGQEQSISSCYGTFDFLHSWPDFHLSL